MKQIIVTILTLFIVFQANCQNKKAPNFTVTDYKGNEHKLYEDFLSKDKAVLIKFFFVDCPPCNSIAPSVQQIYSQNWDSGNGRVEFIELSVKGWDTDNKVKGYTQKHGISFPSVSADGGSVAATDPYTSGQFGLFRGTPTFVVIGPDSIVHFDIKFNQINDTLTEVLKKDTTTSGCTNAFSIDIKYWNNPIQDSSNIILQLESDIQGSKTYALNEKEGKHHYECEYVLPIMNQSYFVRPKYDGVAWTDVSTRDLVAIQKHLLGIKLFKHTATKIAADANDSKTVSISDITTIRKVILGQWAKFRAVPSHRFWEADTDFSADTFPYRVPEFKSQTALMDLVLHESTGLFGCVKMGDVTTVENRLNGIKTRNAQTLYLGVDDIQLENGVTYHIPLQVINNQNILGIQGGFASNDKIEIESISYSGSKQLNFETYHDTERKEIRFLWFDTDEMEVDKQVFILKFTAKSSSLLSQSLEFNQQSIKALYTNDTDTEGRIKLRFSKPSINKTSVNPNPVINAKLYLTNYSVNMIKSINIYNLNGIVVHKQNLSKNQSHIIALDLPLMLKGLFLLELKMTNGKYENHKILIR